ncbi:glycyl-tRNA synthetase beta chain [Desulfofundulus australicus DSM 11792]|uniref:Glycine--tRNA ligase beta subunit n=1 Tax=Desulfofundulus australicus DSM 11792 TaxID=1121425 RepID=A0A1M4UZU3_9FIRM|nr:glycine--tRNA ligase subunit beta [Desulfofundulus australicus]SHE62195.1 glycyl-tRNA synthetase beta chain [Desulfofundulus australicus DSM 11792]
MQTGDFLLEIGVEEIPARFLNPALEQLKELAQNLLRENRLSFKEIKTFGTPRRLVLYVYDLAGVQESLVQEVKGPAVKVAFNQAGEPTRAALGFAKSQGVDVSQLVVKNLGPVEYVFAVKRQEGRPAGEVLADICPAIISGLHFPKPMRWGTLEVRFARPIRWLVALYGDQVIDFSYAGLRSGRVTYGHRFLSEGPLEIPHAGKYFEVMERGKVVVDPGQRREMIWNQVKELAAGAGGQVLPDEELLAEVTNLVEYPVALCGSFDESFLQLPAEVLVTPMREHQRYFPVRDARGKLLPRFIAVSNGNRDHLDTIRAGNEKVLRARLTDAAFFWKEDQAVPLARRVEALKKVVWQESLGSVYDKVERLINLSRYLARVFAVGEKELEQVLRAAYLAKADLVTNMVYEFPELQGVMGREYALVSGEDPAVAQAIYEHYLPRFSGDELPVTTPGRVLSLADKMDTLVGCFAIGIEPTGSQDPYGLRRQALGICHICLAGELVLPLQDFIGQAYEQYRGRVELKLEKEQVISHLLDFFAQRLRGILTERGLSYDTVEAVLAAGFDDPTGVWQRARAVEVFKTEPHFEAVLTAFTRAHNLSRKHDSTAVDPALLAHPAEAALYKKLNEVREKVAGQLMARDYRAALAAMASLRPVVDEFFDAVMVMVDDEKIRNNRLGLLKGVANLALDVADLSKLVAVPGDKLYT